MRLDELKTVLEKYGYRLLGYRRFKNRDRLKLKTPENLIVTLTLTRHIEQVEARSILRWILGGDEYKGEFGSLPFKGFTSLERWMG